MRCLQVQNLLSGTARRPKMPSVVQLCVRNTAPGEKDVDPPSKQFKTPSSVPGAFLLRCWRTKSVYQGRVLTAPCPSQNQHRVSTSIQRRAGLGRRGAGNHTEATLSNSNQTCGLQLRALRLFHRLFISMATTETLQGYLVVKVLEAAGHNGDDVRVWDDSLKEAFVKSRCLKLTICCPPQPPRGAHPALPLRSMCS